MSKLFGSVRRAYVNGQFVSPEQAQISAFDRGFIFGDGIYEVIPAYGGQPFRWGEHLARLNGNLATVGISEPLTREQWEAVFSELLRDFSEDQYIYLQVTRGVAPRDHVFPADARPTVFAYTQALAPVARAQLETGVAAVTLEDIRWRRCDLKTTSLIGNVWLRQQASAQGAAEAILVRDGVVTEGAATNVFAVIDGVVQTPPHGPQLLPGITRDLVVELLDRHGLAFAEQSFSLEAMMAADEVWITSSTKEILPVTSIDGRPVAGGASGEVFWRALGLFQAYKAECRAGKEA